MFCEYGVVITLMLETRNPGSSIPLGTYFLWKQKFFDCFREQLVFAQHFGSFLVVQILLFQEFLRPFPVVISF